MKFGIGQLVRVKYFKDLVKEHEADSQGNITIGSCIFLREMKVYCGEQYKVKNNFGGEYELDLQDGGDWFFSQEMLELPYAIDKEETKSIVEPKIEPTIKIIDKDTQEVEQKPKRQYNRKKVE